MKLIFRNIQSIMLYCEEQLITTYSEEHTMLNHEFLVEWLAEELNIPIHDTLYTVIKLTEAGFLTRVVDEDNRQAVDSITWKGHLILEKIRDVTDETDWTKYFS